MTTKTIYRIEHSTSGKGAYNGGGSCAFDGNATRHPHPMNDSLFKLNYLKEFNSDCFDKYSYYFGFSSLEQLKNWFYQNHWFDNLAELNFKLYIYESDDYIEGNTQIAFRKDWADLIEVKELETLKD